MSESDKFELVGEMNVVRRNDEVWSISSELKHQHDASHVTLTRPNLLGHKRFFFERLVGRGHPRRLPSESKESGWYEIPTGQNGLGEERTPG